MKEQTPIEKAFDQFKKDCLEYQQRFELGFWKINFTLLPLGKICLSRTKADPNSFVAEIELNKEVPLEYLTPEEIKRGARHEVIHILTRKLRALADNRYTTPSEVAGADEELTKRLEQILK